MYILQMLFYVELPKALQKENSLIIESKKMLNGK